MPALIGEITVGIIAGPHVKNLVPETNALILQGEIALAVAALQLETMQAFSIGASFATMLLNLTQWKKGGIAKGMRVMLVLVVFMSFLAVKVVKRVATFLMRYFFACSIGFTVPVEDFGNVEVWKRASVLLLCVFAKLCMGFFAMPLTFNDFLILGFAWGSWGEFSFILALRAVRGNLLSGESYSALVLAVLISILICPTVLRVVLTRREIEAKRRIEEAKRLGRTLKPNAQRNEAVYFCVQTRSRAQWGQQGALLNGLLEVGCKVVDFRSFHPFHDVGTQHIINELYLKDMELELGIVLPKVEDQQTGSAETPANRANFNVAFASTLLMAKDLAEAANDLCRKVTSQLRRRPGTVTAVPSYGWQPGEGTQELIEEVHYGSATEDVPVGSFRRTASPSEQIAAQHAHLEMQQAMTTRPNLQV
ncbi:Putative Na(+)/H(+) antiporter GerT [Durusdinium trenchii]|uniref:Na(+)/H(+) antiporter GerT n=1 Tax=Durusdinium trenchii TaxID=1381693 RepID=A0ABP0PH29_9DINO